MPCGISQICSEMPEELLAESQGCQGGLWGCRPRSRGIWLNSSTDSGSAIISQGRRLTGSCPCRPGPIRSPWGTGRSFFLGHQASSMSQPTLSHPPETRPTSPAEVKVQPPPVSAFLLEGPTLIDPLPLWFSCLLPFRVRLPRSPAAPFVFSAPRESLPAAMGTLHLSPGRKPCRGVWERGLAWT